MSRPEQSGGRVTATEKKLIARGRLSPTKEVTGGRRATLAQESGASAGFRGRGADCATAREPGRPREAWSLRERAKNRKPEGQGSQREAAVCRRPGVPNKSGRAERPRVYAVAEPAATPEDRQSERSEVCRDRAMEKYKMPEGRAGRRVAVVRPAPEAGREPHRGGRARAADGRKGGAQPGPDGRRRPRGRAGENGAASGAPSRKGTTPRRDPGDCNAGRLPSRSVKRWSGKQRTGELQTCGLEIKHRARISKGGAGPGAEERAGTALARVRKGKMQAA